MGIDTELAQYRPYLLRYARLQLRNDAWAEDTVSETMLAALAKPQSFGNRSQLKTWLVGILKHKLIDALRLRRREVSLQDDDPGGDELDNLAFAADGHFAARPAEWGDPEQTLASAARFSNANCSPCGRLLAAGGNTATAIRDIPSNFLQFPSEIGT